MADSGWFSVYTALLVGLLSVMVGAELSILMPVIGPAVAQLPTLSQTCTELVESFPLPAPWATGSDVSVMLDWAELASPEPVSLAVQVNETVPECQLASAAGAADRRRSLVDLEAADRPGS